MNKKITKSVVSLVLGIPLIAAIPIITTSCKDDVIINKEICGIPNGTDPEETKEYCSISAFMSNEWIVSFGSDSLNYYTAMRFEYVETAKSGKTTKTQINSDDYVTITDSKGYLNHE
ncbi:MAG: hypothetical protein K2M43_00825 [Mycoplasmoidaceae bacterium]|nr:hypothetical protein [Mycoplasmoidaceae bacterium]